MCVYFIYTNLFVEPEWILSSGHIMDLPFSLIIPIGFRTEYVQWKYQKRHNLHFEYLKEKKITST